MFNDQFKLKNFTCFLFALCMLVSEMHAQQNIQVSGKIIAQSDGQPIPGVSVLVQGSAVGTSTDAEGRYSLSVPSNASLLIKAVGYQEQRIKVTGNVINLTLVEEENALDEVVVVGYGTTTKENLTTSVSKIDPKKIPTAANSSVPELLFGRAAGLQVNQQSSQPGGNINVSIRGKGTPLIVVDGVVFPNNALEPDNGSVEIQGVDRGPLAGLNPNDIESIEILKDASAAIYGVSAANGVMYITTKKGKAGRMNISYDANHSFVNNMKYLEPLNARDYMVYHNQLSVDKYLSDNNMEPFGQGTPDLRAYSPRFTQEQINGAGEGTRWLDQVLRNGNVDNHQLSLNGGTEKVTYYTSANYYKQTGTVKNSDLTRWSGRLNVTFALSKWLSLNTNVNANRNEYANPQAGWQTGGAGTQGFNALQAALGYPSTVPIYDTDGNYSIFAVTGNPVSLLTIKDQTKFNGLTINTSLDFTLIPNELTAKVLYGNNDENSLRNFFIPSNVFWGQLYRSRASLAETRRQNQTMEATVSYRKRLNEWLAIDAVTGVGQYLEDFSGFNVEAFDMPDVINTDNLATATGIPTIGSYRGKNKLRSFFIRSNVELTDRFVLSLSLRRDGADKFFPDKKYQNFPSASLAYKFSNEPFIKKIEAISLLKLRTSYGTAGERPGSVAYGAYGPDATAIAFENGSVRYIPYRVNAFTNPNLQWPITKTFNAGFDFGLFRDRINGSFDYFIENKTRLLTNATTPQLSIISTSPVNGGHQRRTGFDFSLNTVNLSSDNFTWNSVVNLTHYQNRWVERFANEPPPPYAGVTDPVGSNIIYVYPTAGILQIGQEVPAWQPQNAQKPGSPIFVDSNGDGALNFDDVVSYSGIPKLIVGFGNNFTYKNFDLGIFLYGQFGAWGYDYTTLWGDPVNLLGNQQGGTTRIKDAWSTSNPSGTQPGAAFNEAALGLDPGVDTRLAKRDFLRCRNITLGYTFRTGAISKLMNSLRVYADVQNAFIITGFDGVDPEVQAVSIKGGPAPYPMARTISLGLRASF